MVAQACDPSIHQAEAGEVQVQGQPGLYSKALSQNKENKKREKK
jgi:hypothetical protein